MSKWYEQLEIVSNQIRDHFYKGIIPFWMNRGIDKQLGGYLTCYDRNGNLDLRNTNKYLVSQTRMIWGFSVFSQLLSDNNSCKDAAAHGVDFLITNFWDRANEGWFWQVTRDGSIVDDGKILYGQCFAIYALAQHYLSTGDLRSLEYAERTFNIIHCACTDSVRGGYYEIFNSDWTLANPGFDGGDRKTLDIHMHMMECLTTLFQASGKQIHKRRLMEVIELINSKMIDRENGCGLNQFDLYFNSISEVAIRRFWPEVRQRELSGNGAYTTSYGHNLELVWLLRRAYEILRIPDEIDEQMIRALVNHTLKFGIDWNNGGIYQDGLIDGPAIRRDKEWWQHAEALVGLIDAFILFGDQRYLDAFLNVWDFSNKNLINHEQGEWMTLVSENGVPIESDLGNTWKACYHTGRAMHETLTRLNILLGQGDGSVSLI
jgi:cellobiose epimerase